MKAMRVLNCTKEDREIIFKIADKVGCPVYAKTRIHDEIDEFPAIIFDGFQIVANSARFPASDYENVSFSEFITELLKYEKPKVWVRKETAPMTNVEVEIESSPIAWCYIPKNSRNHKFTYEVEE